MKILPQKKKQGFTLLEMLITVAILAVLAAVVIPSVASIRDALLYRQRTDRAKTIFLTAQRQLIHLRAAGELAGFDQCSPAVSQSGEADLEGFVYVTWTDRDFVKLVPESSLDEEILSGKSIIVFSPETAAVYAVYYSDDPELALEYAAGILPRERSCCREELLGYHGGENLSSAQLGVARVAAEVSYIDGQAGLVSIRVPTQNDRMENLFADGNYQRYANGLKIDLTVTGERGGVLEIPVKEAGEMAPYSLQPGPGGMSMLCFTVCLDSLVGGSFSENGQILPGDNVSLRVDVNFLPGPEDPLILVDTAVAAGINPMFASFSQISPRRWAITVSNGRHLQNLNVIAPAIAGEVNVVVLSVGTTGKSGDQVIDWQDTMDYYGGSLNFTPIHSPWLFGSGTLSADGFSEIFHRQKNAEIVGCDTVIRNLRIDSSGTMVGLFACLDTDVDGVYLENPRIRGEAALAVGGLVGAAGENCTITDCGIYSEEPGTGLISGSGWVGGLAGFVESSREDVVTLRNCFNRVTVSGDENARVGGLAGANRGGYIRDCYVLAEVDGAAGFVAANSGRIRGCSANVIMENGSCFVAENTGLVETSYGWVSGGGELAVPGDCRGCYFARLDDGEAAIYDREGIPSSADHIDALAEPGARTQLGTGWYMAGRFPAHPIDEKLTDYPYPMNGDHYGDWATPGTGHGCGVLYYECYGDGTVGVHMENLSQYVSGDFMPLKTGEIVQEAGYALWFRTGTMPFDRETEAMVGSPLDGLHAASGLPEIYSICALDAEGQISVRLREGYDSATIITWYADTLNRTQPPFCIRCQSQLENIGKWQQGEFLLEGRVTLDETYQGPETFSGTLTGAEDSRILVRGTEQSLVGTLTGRLQNIRVEGVTGKLSSGLLADRVEGGTISGCEIAGEVHTAAGAVAGTVLSGKIENCIVSGMVVPLAESCGSFVGNAQGGKFRDCHVLTDNGLPFGGIIAATRQEIPGKATHFADTYAPEGRYAQINADSTFTALTELVPIYDAAFENCSFLRNGEAFPVMSLRYYYRLEPAEGYQAWANGPDTGQYALVTADGMLLGVNEAGQIAALRDFTRVNIPEADIWVAAEDGYCNFAAPEAQVELTILSEGEETLVQVEYTEAVEITVTQTGPDGSTVTDSGVRQQPRTLKCRLYRVRPVTDWIAVWVAKGNVLTEVDGS